LEKMTLTIIKPDSVSSGKAGQILAHLEGAGFRIRALRMTRLSRETAGEFYAEHRGKVFFEPLIEFMISGPVIVAALSRKNAVAELRRIIGATDPAEAEPDTVRAIFAESKTRNAIHGSDSDNSARRELDFFFSRGELVRNGG